ncbi:hypothetical protein [Nocardia transvalensis]|uniref:hypothetical protein n=1 Tax=Nocardia transvalensis TaxID=37333 RepID=UPI001896026C|nr:hypothetical protein [Nocardia transvalensis]MBF6333369.1 hypothetical protein [Nocardia transvalensis]
MSTPDPNGARPAAAWLLSGDPFGDGQSWTVRDRVRDDAGRIVRVLYECRYLVESGTGRARVIERRWHDGVHESRTVTPID